MAFNLASSSCGVSSVWRPHPGRPLERASGLFPRTVELDWGASSAERPAPGGPRVKCRSEGWGRPCIPSGHLPSKGVSSAVVFPPGLLLLPVPLAAAAPSFPSRGLPAVRAAGPTLTSLADAAPHFGESHSQMPRTELLLGPCSDFPGSSEQSSPGPALPGSTGSCLEPAPGSAQNVAGSLGQTRGNGGLGTLGLPGHYSGDRTQQRSGHGR